MKDLSQCFIRLIEENDLSQVAELIGIDKATCKSLERFRNICFSTSLSTFIFKSFYFYYLKVKNHSNFCF
jgi:hypothetical protein